MNLPTQIEPLLTEAFIDQIAYGQIATVDQNQQPSIRTVHLHLRQNQILINTHTLSEKWIDLKHNPNVSGCYFWKEPRIQIRFSGMATLMNQQSHPKDPLLETMWLKMRSAVRIAYLLSDQNIALYKKNIDVDPKPISENHGVIVCNITKWDIFWDHKTEYRFGKRSLFSQIDGTTWSKKDISSLHEKDIVLYDNPSNQKGS